MFELVEPEKGKEGQPEAEKNNKGRKPRQIKIKKKKKTKQWMKKKVFFHKDRKKILSATDHKEKNSCSLILVYCSLP